MSLHPNQISEPSVEVLGWGQYIHGTLEARRLSGHPKNCLRHQVLSCPLAVCMKPCDPGWNAQNWWKSFRAGTYLPHRGTKKNLSSYSRRGGNRFPLVPCLEVGEHDEMSLEFVSRDHVFTTLDCEKGSIGKGMYEDSICFQDPCTPVARASSESLSFGRKNPQIIHPQRSFRAISTSLLCERCSRCWNFDRDSESVKSSGSCTCPIRDNLSKMEKGFLFIQVAEVSRSEYGVNTGGSKHTLSPECSNGT